MTSKVIGKRWLDHPLLVHFLDPIPIEIHLKFETWNPATGLLDPVANRFVRVVVTDSADNVTDLRAVQPPSTVPTDLKQQTDSAGAVSFQGKILGSKGGLTIHFEVDGLASGTWSTAGWKSRDNLAHGKIVGFSGQPVGTAGAPVTFLVGIPCWLKFGYHRKYKEAPAASFPSGTRVKLITLGAGNAQVDQFNIRTNAASEFKDVLFTVKPGAPLRLLVFTRFRPADDDGPLVMNPFDIGTEDVTTLPDDDVPLDVLGDRPFLYYDPGPSTDPAGYAFHFTGWAATLDQVKPWIPAADTFSLCEWEAATGSVKQKAVVVEMPDAFSAKHKSGKAKVKEKMAFCAALHAATMIREFHWLLSAIAHDGNSPRAKWAGLNLNSTAPRRLFLLTQAVGPHTEPNNSRTQAEVHFPPDILYDDDAFLIPNGSRNEYRYVIFRNIVLHELGHCLMYRYSFDSAYDESILTDHCFNAFIEQKVDKDAILPFWEGWAVYFSLLLLGPNDFLRSQLARVAALDGEHGKSDILAVESLTVTALDHAIENIFASTIFKSYAIQSAAGIESGLKLSDVLVHTAVSKMALNIGQASELCLAFSLYNLTRFLVQRAPATWTAPGASDGSGRLPATGWYNDQTVRDSLWTSIFEPFLALKESGVTTPGPDTIEKFTKLIQAALLSDDDWHTILKMFNTYYLLVEEPRNVTISPASPVAGGVAQALAVTGSGFPAASTAGGDAGLRVEIDCPATVAQPGVVQSGLTFNVIRHFSVSVSVVLPAAGTYTLRFIGRWGTKSVTLVVK